MNSIISWVGGKKSLRDLIYQRMPISYDRYIEIPRRYPVETLKYSDIIISALAVMVCVLFSILLIDCWVESMIVARASCDNP